MNAQSLSKEELMALIQRVFQPGPHDDALAILVDLPDDSVPDNPDWETRRFLAAEWTILLAECQASLGVVPSLFAYRNVHSNNADLPTTAWKCNPTNLPRHYPPGNLAVELGFDEVLRSHRLVIAPTELSATAPLKMLAPKLGFRAATMPGFSSAMVPALRLDYAEINRRVGVLKQLLDRATAAHLAFVVDGRDEHHLTLDLRHRAAHASGGLLPTPGTAGNLPSGEAYIVPYEGERSGDESGSHGSLPVQHDDEVVVYRIAGNRAVDVISTGRQSRLEADHLVREPAYGNIAELGLGVLDDFGIQPIGEVLLDEKLGLHVAFGRSEHFGGQVGPLQFSSPQEVVHQDHVYLPALQPRVLAAKVTLDLDDGKSLVLMEGGRYVIDFGRY